MRRHLHGYGLLLVALLLGCSSTSIYVPVSMPAEIDLRNAQVVGVAMYRTSESSPWSVPVSPLQVTRAFGGPFTMDPRFATVNMYESKGGAPDAFENIALTKNVIANLAEVTGADVLVFGEVLHLDYNEDIIEADVHRFQKADGKQIVRKGLLRLMVHIRIVNAATQEMIWNSVLERSVKAETSAADSDPARIDPLPLADEAAALVARDVLDLSEKVTENVLVTFLTDSDYPGIDAAVKKAQAGDWHEALQRFKKLAAEAEGSEDEHKLLYNLGVAHQFSYDFRKAYEAFEKASKLNDTQRYKIAMDECLKMEQLYQESVKQE